MNRSIRFAALAACSVPALAQQAAPPPPVLVPSTIAALRDDALANDTYAWDLTEALTTEIGPRLAGTDAEARARDWSVRKLTAMGFANARIAGQGPTRATFALDAVRAPAFFAWIRTLERRGLVVESLRARANSDRTLAVEAAFRARGAA